MKAFITLAVVCFIVQAMAGPLELSEEQKTKAKELFFGEDDVVFRKLDPLFSGNMVVLKSVLSNCKDYKGEGPLGTALKISKCLEEYD